MELRSARAACIALLCFAPLLSADWLTFGHDPQRSAWSLEEAKLTPGNAKDLELKWSLPLDNSSLALNALTAPLAARNVATADGAKALIYVAGSANHVFAVDAATGKLVWQKTLQSYVNAKAESFYLCPNAVNATPVIDRKQNLIFVLANDGRVFGLDLGTGATRFGPFQLVPPFAKTWSLNLYGGFIYTTTSQGCGGDRSGIYSMQVSDASHHVTYEALVGAGMWDRGGPAIGDHGGLYVTTGDGPFNPSTGDYGSTFLAASTPDLNLTDYYSPLNWNEMNKKDLDLPSGGLLWFGYKNYHLIVGGGKESALYLLNADTLGSEDHQTALSVSPIVGNEAKVLEEKGIWGAPALWRDEEGQAWIYTTLWGEPLKEGIRGATQNGSAPHGSVLAFKVEMNGNAKTPCLKLMWISADVNLPDAPAVANGVVFVVATGENPRQDKMLGKSFKSEQDWKNNLLTTEERAMGTHPAELMALDAKTGKMLYQSADAMKTWVHFGGVAIDDGKIYTTDHSSTLYCFGLRAR